MNTIVKKEKTLNPPLLIDETINYYELYEELYDLIRNTMLDALGVEPEYGHGALDIINVVAAADKWADRHGLWGPNTLGLRVVDVSSKQSLPSFPDTRTVTVVGLERRTLGWYLVLVGTLEFERSELGTTHYWITEDQDGKVKDWLGPQYSVLPEDEGE